jgi:hypothetical protein
MYISRKLKQENIVEYLLYMWQVEDLLRANELDIDKITVNVVDKYQLDEAQRAELVEWYDHLIEMMRREQVEKSGHLQINKNVIINLTDLHLQLMRCSKYPYYQAAYYQALPFIVEYRTKSAAAADLPELENCFEALYGVWMLKLRHREISADTAKAMESIVQFMGLLSDYYFQDKKGKLKFD